MNVIGDFGQGPFFQIILNENMDETNESAVNESAYSNEEINDLYAECISGMSLLKNVLTLYVKISSEKSNSKLLTSGEVCKYFGISKLTLKRYRENKVIPCTLLNGQYKFLYEDVVKLTKKEV